MQNFSDLTTSVNIARLQEIAATYGLKLLGSLAILLLAWLIAKYGTAAIRAALERLGVEQTLNKFLTRLASVIVWGVGVLAALGNLGVDTTSFVALFTACSFAISFAFKETLSNIAAGVLVIVFRPFLIGDLVKLGAGSGRVKDISMFSVTLQQPDNTLLIVPNGKVVNDVILNYSREGKRAVSFERSCAPADVCELSAEAKSALSALAMDGEVNVYVAAIGAADVSLKIEFYAEAEEYDRAFYAANEALAKALIK